MSIDEAELEEFLTESFEMLDEVEAALLEVDRGALLTDYYNAVFRVLHSLKGASGMLGLDALKDHVHQLETQFQTFQGVSKISSEISAYFLKGVDACRDLLKNKSIQFDYALPVPRAETQAIKSHATQPQVTTSPSVLNTVPSETVKSPTDLLIERPVYIIDDEADIVDILSGILQGNVAKIQGFTDAEAALQAIQKHKPEVILTDMKMPKISGLELIQKVRAIDPDIPVVLVSGHVDKTIAVDSLNQGASAIIEKPFSESQVLAVCMDMIRRSKLNRLLNQSINFILYQFSDLDRYLEETGKHEIRQIMNAEFKLLMEARRALKKR